MSKIDEIKELILLGCYNKIPSAIAEGIAGIDDIDDEYIYQILNDGIIAAINEAGYNFMDHTSTQIEMLLSCKAIKVSINAIQQYFSKDTEPLGKVIIGTIQNDLHEFGKNIVKMMLECAGFNVIDLGVNVSPIQFINALYKHLDTKIICCSCSVFDAIPNINSIIETLYTYKFNDSTDILNQIKIMIGGQAINENYYQMLSSLIFESIKDNKWVQEKLAESQQMSLNPSIFNIYYTPDAFLAVQKAKELVGK